MAKSKVFFIRDITPENVVRIYKQLGIELPGKVAVKLHSGEPGNQNFLRPEIWQPMIREVNGTIVECNTAYEGGRNTTERHLETMKKHGWSDCASVDILDAEKDLELDIPEGACIKKNYVGSHMSNYDSLLVLTHFKGHPMGGFGGSIKNIAIGLASSYGKAYIHGVGDASISFRNPDHDAFLVSMADAAKSIKNFFGEKIAFINVMANMSVDCDCCAVAADPMMGNIGILASLDPVAVDQACLDLVYASEDEGKSHLIKRIESRNGLLTVEAAEKIGLGNRAYELIEL